jgi:hypothetical protein
VEVGCQLLEQVTAIDPPEEVAETVIAGQQQQRGEIVETGGGMASPSGSGADLVTVTIKIGHPGVLQGMIEVVLEIHQEMIVVVLEIHQEMIVVVLEIHQEMIVAVLETREVEMIAVEGNLIEMIAVVEIHLEMIVGVLEIQAELLLDLLV